VHLSRHHQRRGQDLVTLPLLRRLRFTGEHVLIDGGKAVGDDSVNGHHLAGVDDNGVTRLEGLDEHLHLDAVDELPNGARLLTQGLHEAVERPILCDQDQFLADVENDQSERTGEEVAAGKSPYEIERTHHVHA
jgi:hypothetical protein